MRNLEQPTSDDAEIVADSKDNEVVYDEIATDYNEKIRGVKITLNTAYNAFKKSSSSEAGTNTSV